MEIRSSGTAGSSGCGPERKRRAKERPEIPREPSGAEDAQRRAGPHGRPAGWPAAAGAEAEEVPGWRSRRPCTWECGVGEAAAGGRARRGRRTALFGGCVGGDAGRPASASRAMRSRPAAEIDRRSIGKRTGNRSGPARKTSCTLSRWWWRGRWMGVHEGPSKAIQGEQRRSPGIAGRRGRASVAGVESTRNGSSEIKEKFRKMRMRKFGKRRNRFDANERRSPELSKLSGKLPNGSGKLPNGSESYRADLKVTERNRRRNEQVAANESLDCFRVVRFWPGLRTSSRQPPVRPKARRKRSKRTFAFSLRTAEVDAAGWCVGGWRRNNRAEAEESEKKPEESRRPARTTSCASSRKTTLKPVGETSGRRRRRCWLLSTGLWKAPSMRKASARHVQVAVGASGSLSLSAAVLVDASPACSRSPLTEEPPAACVVWPADEGRPRASSIGALPKRVS